MHDIMDVNIACSMFYNKLYALFDLSIPKSAPRNQRHYPPWFTSEVITNLRVKSSMYKQFKRTKNQHHFNLFKTQRAFCKKLISEAYKAYLCSAENSLSNDPKKLWSFINNKKGSTDIPGLLHHNNIEISDPLEIVNVFGH